MLLPPSSKKIGWITATALVVANMVGTGAFTSLGLQLEEVQNTWSILLVWVLGGAISLCGALCYAELSTHIPRSGGEYRFLSEMVHPFAGYLSGWVSLTVGFAAAVALAAMAMAAYLSGYAGIPPALLASAAIVGISAVHSFSIRQSGFFQDLFTILKVLLLLALIAAGLWLDSGTGGLRWDAGWRTELPSTGFAVALVIGLYAYSGWNAAAYIVEEIRDPARNVPRALIGGTLLVSVLYILLQLIFLRQAPPAVLSGKVEVGQIVAREMFGPAGGRYLSFAIGFLLVSSISAMIWVGPRVTRAIAADYPLWAFLARDNSRGIPVRAIWLQSAISIGLIFSGSFETVLLYSGFVLQLSTTLTVAASFRLRRRAPENTFRSALYPLPQVIYLAASGWLLVFLLIDRPWESLLGASNLVLGAATYWLSRRR